MAQPAAAARRRWWRQQRRDGEMKTVSEGGGQRESGEGGSLKGPRREGERFGSLPHSVSLCSGPPLSSSHPSIQAPSLGSLGVVMETGGKTRQGGWD